MLTRFERDQRAFEMKCSHLNNSRASIAVQIWMRRAFSLVPMKVLILRALFKKDLGGVMKIFISHASEDKDIFVRPLAEKLKEHYEIWYDEHELKVGDSLREKIDEGLKQCDYGIVVLSKSFFSKKWTQNELNGLLGLETANHKMLLPIWLGIGEEDVKAYSPILADRKALLASTGIDRVVDDIKLAVSTTENAKKIMSKSNGQMAIQRLINKVSEKELNERVLRCESGVKFVNDDISYIKENVKKALDNVCVDNKKMFRIDGEIVWGPLNFGLKISVQELYGNSAIDSKLRMSIFRVEMFGNNPQLQMENFWSIKCASETELRFIDSSSNLMNRDEVVDCIVASFCNLVHAKSD